MKKIMIASLALVLLPAFAAFAQDEKKVIETDAAKSKKERKQVDEIIIRRQGEKGANTTVTVEITGDKVMVNGKPIEEFKDDNITINTRKILVGTKNKSLFVPYNAMQYPEMGSGWEGQHFDFWKDGDGKAVKRTFLGVTTEDDDKGARITEVNEGSAAEKAGLKKEDIITKVGDKTVSGPASLSEAITALQPKQEVKITYLRSGKEMSAAAVLGERVERNVQMFSMTSPEGGGPFEYRMRSLPRINRGTMNLEERLAGLGDLNVDVESMLGRRPRIGLRLQDTEEGAGVKIIDIDEDSPAEKAGLKKDDIITSINGKGIKNTDEAREALRPEAAKKSFAIKAKRNGSEMSFEVKIPVKLKTADF